MVVHTYKEVSTTRLEYFRTFASFDAANAYMEYHAVCEDWHNFERPDNDVSPPPYITREADMGRG